jgi:hypothetical protein
MENGVWEQWMREVDAKMWGEENGEEDEGG